MTEHTMVLPDGRTLGYSVYGAAEDKPLLYFHGTPSSRLELKLLNQYGVDIEQQILDAGLKIIAVDRPGMGLSSFNAKGTFLSFAFDVSVLLQSLGISNCPVLCWSGGGPYALAIAWQYPSLINGIYIICGFSRSLGKQVFREMNAAKLYFRSAKCTPLLLEGSLNLVRDVNPSHPLPKWITGLPQVDYRLIKSPTHLETLINLTLKEACREGAKGALHEARLYFKDFGFALSDIMQTVHYWWGTKDNTVVHAHAKEIEERIKNKVMHYKKDEGHLSLYIYFFHEVLQTIAAKETEISS
jgi:pimeloyl-ACP methyl ester carboxylesterase